MRSTDRAWRQRGSVIAMLAETDQDGARQFVARISDVVAPTDVQLSSFPDDAVTVDGLYDTLHAAEPVRNLVAVEDDDQQRPSHAVGET